MKPLATLLLVPPLAAAALALTRSQDPAPPAPVPTRGTEGHLRAPQPWEYKVVGLTEIHANTLDALKGMVDDARSGENDLLSWALKADERLVQKTQAVLDEHGVEGWELVEYRENVLVFKRPRL